MPPKERITDIEVLNFINNFVNSNSYSPSFSQINLGVGYNSTSAVSNKLSKMKTSGLITYSNSTARSINIENKGFELLNSISFNGENFE